MREMIERMMYELNEDMSDRTEKPKVYWKQYHLEDIININAFDFPEEIIRNYVSEHNYWAVNWVIKNNLHFWNRRKIIYECDANENKNLKADKYE